jgi:hypothetical protein
MAAMAAAARAREAAAGPLRVRQRCGAPGKAFIDRGKPRDTRWDRIEGGGRIRVMRTEVREGP